MKIKPTYVTFEQAIWLKDKGFDEFCEGVYVEYHKTTEFNKKGVKFEASGVLNGRNSQHSGSQYYSIYSAPEQHVVVEWLRVNHGIFLFLEFKGFDDFSNSFMFYISAININKNSDLYKNQYIIRNDEKLLTFNSPQEAYSAAFDYILKELI